MLEHINSIISLATIIGFVITLIARFVPNEKIFNLGLSTGKFLNGFGSAKLGSVTWEKIEHFLVNSLGEYFRGVKSGLDDSDGG